MPAKPRANRCKGTTKSGEPCRAAATEGGLCFFHTNTDKASELGRIGGRSNRHVAAGENADPRQTLHTALAVRETVARLIADVLAGRISPRIAAGLAPLLNLQLQAIKTTDLEQRLARLEKPQAAGDAEAADGKLADDDFADLPGEPDSEAGFNGKKPTRTN